MAKWIGKGILDGSHKSEAFLHAFDTGCTKLEYQTTKREVVGCSAKSAMEKEPLEPATSSSGRKNRVEKSASNLIFPEITLKN